MKAYGELTAYPPANKTVESKPPTPRRLTLAQILAAR